MHRYRVEAEESGIVYPIFEPLTDYQMYDDEFTQELGSTSMFSCTLPLDSQVLESINPLSTQIRIYDRDDIEFEGRVISDKRDIINTGIIQAAGPESYLADSQQEPFRYSGTVDGFIRFLLERHNAQNDVKFQVGTVTVTDPNNYIVRELNQYTDTLTVLREKTEGMLGGWLRFRRQSSQLYLIDYQMDYGKNGQSVRFSENMLDLISEKEPADFFTRLIPLGSELDANDTTDIPRFTKISSVNGGKDYLEDPGLIRRYGVITKTVQWKDITDPNNLLKKAQNYMENAFMPICFDIKAVDLSYIEDVDEFEVGKKTSVISLKHGVDTEYILSKKTRHITKPAADTVTLGELQQTLTKEVVKNESQTSQTIEDVKTDTNNTIVQTGMTISGAKGGYVVMDSYDNDGNAIAPWQILIMDAPDKKQARNVIRLNQNGIGFSTDGYNGTYRNAWTIDGVLSADFIRTGSLIVGGSIYNTNGSIEIRDSADNVLGRFDKSGILINKGEINAPNINGGSCNFGDGQLRADSDGAYIGGFYTFKTEYGDYLATESAEVGIGSSSFWSFWAGNRNGESGARIDASDPEQVVNAYGIAMSQEKGFFQEIYLNHPIFNGSTRYWGVGETIDDIYGRISQLESLAESLNTEE